MMDMMGEADVSKAQVMPRINPDDPNLKTPMWRHQKSRTEVKKTPQIEDPLHLLLTALLVRLSFVAFYLVDV